MEIPMTKVALTILAVLGLAGSLAAQSNSQITVNVPFSFELGEKQFPAGEYMVQVGGLGPYVTIRSADSKHSALALAQPAVKTLPQHLGGLTFNKYGDRYFLSKIWTNDMGHEVRKSRAEREHERAQLTARDSGALTIAARK
jgi:hypothetical protein